MVPLATLIALGIISTFAMMVNFLVCFLVYKNKAMRNYTNGFVVSLAVSDILMSFVIFCQYLIGFKNRIIINIAYAVVMFSGVANLCAVTYDRYIAVTQPLRYMNIMHRHCRKLLVSVWVTSIVISVLPVTWHGKDKKRDGHTIYVMLVQILFIIVPFTFIILCHCCIFYHAKKCSGKCRRLSNANQRRASLWRSTTEIKVARVFALVAFMFLLSWFPVIYYTSAAIFNRGKMVPRILLEISPITLALGCIINPIIYSLIKPDFRKTLKKMLSKQPRRGTGDSSASDATSSFRVNQRNGFSLVRGNSIKKKENLETGL